MSSLPVVRCGGSAQRPRPSGQSTGGVLECIGVSRFCLCKVLTATALYRRCLNWYCSGTYLESTEWHARDFERGPWPGSEGAFDTLYEHLCVKYPLDDTEVTPSFCLKMEVLDASIIIS